jgi:uroporphyrin-III C-methyltransferase
MSETVPSSEATPAPVPARPPLAAAVAQLIPFLAFILALLALLLLAWHWAATRSSQESLRQELARKIAVAETLNKETRAIAEQSREASTEAQVRLGVLETRFAETQSQQIALEALYHELSRGRDDWALAEIEQSLLMASQHLQLAGNVKAALIALQNADARLQRLQQPQLIPLRKALHADLERLKTLPFVDTIGISVKLDNVIAAVDTLPLAMEVRPPVLAAADQSDEHPPNGWRRLLREAWVELRQLVRVQRMDQPAVPLLAPAQSYFLRENLKLRLLGARLALLARDQASYKADLSAAREWLVRYYDTRERSVASALATLRNLHESDIDIDAPDMSATLDQLRTLRLARERVVR